MRATPSTKEVIDITKNHPRIANTVLASATEELVWLETLYHAQLNPSDPAFNNLMPYLIVQPIKIPRPIEYSKQQAENFIDKTDKLFFCNVPDDYYQQCFAPVISRYKLTLLALQQISVPIMADLIAKLDFSNIKKIGLRNLSQPVLWLLFYKLIALELTGKKDIIVYTDNDITDDWKVAFSNIKNPQTLQALINNNYPMVLQDLVKMINENTSLETALKSSKANFDASASELACANKRTSEAEAELKSSQAAQLELSNELIATKRMDDERISALEARISELQLGGFFQPIPNSPTTFNWDNFNSPPTLSSRTLQPQNEETTAITTDISQPTTDSLYLQYLIEQRDAEIAALKHTLQATDLNLLQSQKAELERDISALTLRQERLQYEVNSEQKSPVSNQQSVVFGSRSQSPYLESSMFNSSVMDNTIPVVINSTSISASKRHKHHQ
jgi:hypothetical protein